jgi:hypothetical protein
MSFRAPEGFQAACRHAATGGDIDRQSPTGSQTMLRKRLLNSTQYGRQAFPGRPSEFGPHPAPFRDCPLNAKHPARLRITSLELPGLA